jgi:gentisate 1,2-dioxygenase
MRFANPLDGGHVMPTIAAFIQLLPRGMKTESCRSTAGSIFTCLEGGGRTRVGEQRLEWGPRDVFVVPGWYPVRHEADSESVLFSFSDRGLLEKLGLWRKLCA